MLSDLASLLDDRPPIVCPVCASPVPRSGRPGRPATSHPECRRAADALAERHRRALRRAGLSADLVKADRKAHAACDAAEGLARLDGWTIPEAEVEATFLDGMVYDGPPSKDPRDGGAFTGRTSDHPLPSVLGSDDPAPAIPRHNPPPPILPRVAASLAADAEARTNLAYDEERRARRAALGDPVGFMQ
jgi:hypothetical protein